MITCLSPDIYVRNTERGPSLFFRPITSASRKSSMEKREIYKDGVDVPVDLFSTSQLP